MRANPETIAIPTFEETVTLLTNNEDTEYEYFPQHEVPLPSIKKLEEVVDLFRALIFPGYFGPPIVKPSSLRYFAGVQIERLYELLDEQIHSGLCFSNSGKQCNEARKAASEIARLFVARIPEIRRLLWTDVRATFDGDPAAKNYGEIIFCYPSIRAMINYRIAHELLKYDVPLIPRIISEMAHSETGIDINPGAKIGEYFSIDHGTGVVIGETCIIGNHVRLYQGVTLGAKRFTLDEKGNPVKNLPRHPIIEDNVVIYSNANILGRITIGHDSVIGGSLWVTKNVPPYYKLQQQKAVETDFKDGLGI
jgi:serine O-acetyltransferase